MTNIYGFMKEVSSTIVNTGIRFYRLTVSYDNLNFFLIYIITVINIDI